MNLIDEIFARCGLENKSELTYADFQLMMRENQSNFIAIGKKLVQVQAA